MEIFLLMVWLAGQTGVPMATVTTDCKKTMEAFIQTKAFKDHEGWNAECVKIPDIDRLEAGGPDRGLGDGSDD